LVVCLEEEKLEVQRRPYTLESGAAAILVRQQWQTIVILRKARTGKAVAASNGLVGGSPPECQASQQFDSGKSTEYVIGSKPGEAVETWLRPYVEIP
jgi:hypothetical protein